MKKLALLLLLLTLIACQEDEQKYTNSQWEGANGIIAPDTLESILKFNPDNYDAIIRTSVAYPNFPTEDSTQTKIVIAGYFKKGKAFSQIDDFKINGNNITYYKSLFYPSYFYSPAEYFSFYNNDFDITFKDGENSYEYNYEVEDVFSDMQVSSSVLDGDITFNFDKKWDFYSLHAYFVFYKPLNDELYYSMNKTYEKLTPDDLVINRATIKQLAYEKFGISEDYITRVSFSLIASDTSEVMIGNKKTLIYNSAEKIYTFNYVKL